MSKEYKKLLKKYNHELKQQYKMACDSPFDYALGLNFLITYMKFMRDYYALGENVHAEESTKQTRCESISEALTEYNAWQDCIEKYSFAGDDYKREVQEFNKEYKAHRKKFFNLLDKHIEDWWD